MAVPVRLFSRNNTKKQEDQRIQLVNCEISPQIPPASRSRVLDRYAVPQRHALLGMGRAERFLGLRSSRKNMSRDTELDVLILENK
jgi:hypothetical protein